jgi:hypothetical protein
MITCSVCGAQNDDLSVVCSWCRGYLQGRVDALDLFTTLWGLIESPAVTFRRIVLAKHKNYGILLSSLFGVCLIFDIAWYKALANVFSSLTLLVGIALVGGPLIGVVTVLAVSILMRGITRAMGGRASRRNLFAAVAYATMPMGLSLVFIIPLEIAIFGMDFFGTNPPPMLIRPVEYVLLLGLKAVAALYGLYLLILGTMAANAFEKSKFVPVSLSIVGVLGLCLFALTVVQV